MAKARITRIARRELDEIWAFIAQNSGSIETAEHVLDEVTGSMRKLAQMPGMGAMRDELEPGLRSFPVHNYLIFYRAVRGGIQVLHVVHGARNLHRIFDKPSHRDKGGDGND